jgi:hypothetical protein
MIPSIRLTVGRTPNATDRHRNFTITNRVANNRHALSFIGSFRKTKNRAITIAVKAVSRNAKNEKQANEMHDFMLLSPVVLDYEFAVTFVDGSDSDDSTFVGPADCSSSDHRC